MPEEIDYNKIAAELIQNNLEKALAKAMSTATRWTGTLKLSMGKAFREYLVSAAKRYRKSKTILYRNDPVDLYDFYVPLDLKSPAKVIKSANMVDIINVSSTMLITGLAGTGKSTLLRHLFLDTIRHSLAIPVFIELRDLNLNELTLEEFIFQRLKLDQFSLNQEHLRDAMSGGGFALFFDGYDEVNRELKNTVAKSIFQMADSYPHNYFIVSSRPEEEFVSWQHFVELSALPLTKEKAIQLAKNLQYDTEVKEQFIKALQSRLYDKHASFLSNPLLLTIMLMTYSKNSEIPEKKHLFYAQVYETLFNRHDATKAGYKRQTYTSLAMDDFAKVFAAFSAQTYLRGELTLTREKVIEYLNNGKEITGLHYEAVPYLNDLLKSFCLLVPDGLYYAYTHKQFQEYFTAIFINHSSPDQQLKIMSTVCELANGEVLYLLHEMNPDLVERSFILPRLSRILQRAGISKSSDITEETFLKFFRHQCKGIELVVGDDKSESMTYHLTENHSYIFLIFIKRAMQSSVSEPKQPGDDENVRMFVKQNGSAVKHHSDTTYQLKLSKTPTIKSVFDTLSNGRYLNIEDLRYLVDLKDFLEEKHRRSKASIESLLIAPLRSRTTKRPARATAKKKE